VSRDSYTMEKSGRVLFIAMVTCYLLSRILAGSVTPIEIVVYSATAAVGLEFMAAAWPSFWQRG
jgi:hypothetical protein